MLPELLRRSPAQTVDEVIALMQAIDDGLPDSDGVKWFNRLYLRVTRGVQTAIHATTFNDPAFLADLDVLFANQYFAALVDGTAELSRAPAAWRPVFRARQTPRIARIQFALAGMNAHINRDLPDGIVQAFRRGGGDPITDRLRLEDFEAVNDILERVEEEAKQDFTIGIIGVVDQLGGQVDDVVAMWKVRAARAAAWTNAKVLWRLQDLPLLRDEFFTRLDGLTGLAGRGLLRPHRGH